MKRWLARPGRHVAVRILLTCILASLVVACSTGSKERPLGENEEICYAQCKLKYLGQTECMRKCARRYYDYFVP
jgi:hypothetical protein